MDNDDALVGRVLSRREALALMVRSGMGLTALGTAQRVVAGRAPTPETGAHLVASPVLTEGPFFVDEKMKRSDLVGNTTRAAVKNGIPLQLSFTVCKLSDRGHIPLTNAHVDVWHADALGVYSDESNPMNHENTRHQTWLRGFQPTDAAGTAAFRTIFPGWYPGRTPHIHFKIRTYSSAAKVTAEFTSQLFFKDADATRIYTVAPYTLAGQRDTNNANDDIFNQRQPDGTVAGRQMLLDLKPLGKGSGYSAQFTVVLTNTNMRAGGFRGFRGAGGPGGPPPDGYGPPLDHGFEEILRDEDRLLDGEFF